MAGPPNDFIQTEIGLAQEAYQSGNLDAAEARVNKLYEQHPIRADVLSARAMMQMGRGRQDLALETFSASLAIDPDQGEILAWAAFASLNLGRFQEAEAHSKRLAKLMPGNPKAHYLLANALRGQDRIREALEAIDRSLEIKADDVDSLVTKARLLQAWQMPALAFEIYSQAMAIRPTTAAGMELARILLRDSHPEAALDVLKSIESQIPLPERPHALTAEAFTIMHRFDEADERWALAKRHSRNPASIAQRQALMEIAAGRFEVAEKLLFELIEGHQDVTTAFSILTTGRKIRAEDRPLVERMADLPNEDLSPIQRIELNYALGKSFDDLKDFGRAIPYFDEANRVCLEFYRPRREYDREAAKAFTDFLIEISTPERLLAMESKGLESDLPLFIVGMMRSGTTLTESILSSHSEVEGVGEQAFWTERAIEFIYTKSGSLRYDNNLVMQFAKDYLKVMEPRYSGTRHVIDKNPANIEMAATLHGVFPNSKIVHLKRNPVDNLLSLWMTPMSANVRYASNRDNLVFTYREYLRLWRHWQDVLPADRFATFRYEDLTSEPDTTIGEMLDFLELEHEEACFSPEKNARSVLTPSVYQVRQPIHKGSQARWKNYEPWLGSFSEMLDEQD